MSFDDDLKELIDDPKVDTRSKRDSKEAAERIVRTAKKRQSRSDLLDFGFLKLWTVLLEIFSFFFVKLKKTEMDIREDSQKRR